MQTHLGIQKSSKTSLIILALIFSSLFLMLSSCEKEKDDVNLTRPLGNIYNYMDTLMYNSYLWYDKIPSTLSKSNYKSAESYFDAFLYKTIDHWSFIIDKSEYENMVNAGGNTGFGFYIMQEEISLMAKVGLIYKSSEAYAQGIRRGQYVVSINGAPINSSNYNQFYNGTLGDVMQFGIKSDLDDATQIISLSRSAISQDPLLHKEIYQINGSSVGYFAYENFFEYTLAELRNAFSEFNSSQVSDLVIDLRYNGGGQIDIMSKIIGMIVPPGLNGKLSAKVVHNNKVGPYWDTIRNISIEPSNLNLERLFIITSEHSASASESLINELRPYIDIYTIGETTHGKPVGMYGFEYNNTLLFPITFKLLNANDEGEYFNGIDPDAYVYDPISHPLGHIDEPCLKEALHFIENGFFTGGTASVMLRQTSIRNTYKSPFHNILIGDIKR